jgi:DNA-binding transcriptional LysR family regulator
MRGSPAFGGFSAAARECGLSQSQASRLVADLEAELGVRLLSRTTRAVVPTEAGGEFLALALFGHL